MDLAGGGRSAGVAALVFLFCAGLIALPFLSGAYTVPWDAKAHFQPQFAFLAHALHSGQSPFWTPNVFAGSPQLADPQSLIFSPFFLAAAALVAEPTFQLEDGLIFAMLSMGGLALMFFFQDRGWRTAGGLMAALAFAFGGSAAWRIQHTGQVMSLSWFPVTLWLLSRALDRRSAGYGVLAGVAGAFLTLGRDQVALLALLLLAAYALFRLLTDKQPILSAFKPLFAGAFCGVAIITLPLILTLDLAANSNRPVIDLEGAFKGSLPPGAFLTLFCANLFGVDGPLKDFWGPPSAAFGTTDIYLARNMATIYIGALPLAALFAALGPRLLREKEALFFAIATLFFGLYAVGRYTPAFEAFFHIPGIDLWRRPADATFLFCTTLAILGGIALDLLLCGEAVPNLWSLAAGSLTLFAACLAVAFDKDRLMAAAAPLEVAAAFWALAVALVAFTPQLKGKPGLALGLVGALTTLDLAYGGKPNESTAAPPETFEVLTANSKNDTIALLMEKLGDPEPDRRDRVELAAIGFHWPNASLVHGFDHNLGYNPIRLKIYEDATGAIDHVALPEQREFSKLYPRYRSPMSDLLGLRWIATGVPVEQIDKNFAPGDLNFVARTKDAYVYENPRALPRVLLATCARQADFSKMIADGEWPDVDFHDTVLLDLPTICHKKAEGQTGSVRLAAYENTKVTITAEVPPGGGWVELNDVWTPDWFAYVDGYQAPALRANVIFRATPVPEGRHKVEFRYEPFWALWLRLTGRKA